MNQAIQSLIGSRIKKSIKPGQIIDGPFESACFSEVCVGRREFNSAKGLGMNHPKLVRGVNE